MDLKELQKRLEAPFMQKYEGKEFHACNWKPQVAVSNNTKFMCVPFVDRSQVFARLDDVFTPSGWQTQLKEITNGNFICELSVFIDGVWVTKTDIGTQSKEEPEKGAATDSIKRAASQIGIGRYLDSLPTKFVPAIVGTNGRAQPCDDQKKVLFGDQLSNFINLKMSKAQGLLYTMLIEMPELYKRDDIKKLWEELK